MHGVKKITSSRASWHGVRRVPAAQCESRCEEEYQQRHVNHSVKMNFTITARCKQALLQKAVTIDACAHARLTNQEIHGQDHYCHDWHK